MALKAKISKRHCLAIFLLLGGNLLFLLTLWLLNKYDHILLDQVIYQIKTSAAGANQDLLGSAYVQVILFGLLLTALEIFLYLLLSGQLKGRFAQSKRYLSYCTTKACRFFKKIAIPFSAIMLSFSVVLFSAELRLVHYIDASATDSDFIEQHYVNPNEVKLTFPAQKRNLIYIFLESMESTFGDPAAGGSITEDFIPELTALAKENIQFSHTDGLGGALVYNGSTWTAAGMVAQSAGMIVKIPLTAETFGGKEGYMPGIVTIGDVLEKEGYAQTLLVGSDADFAGRETYFIEHGNYNIVDINSLKEEGRLPQDYREWWGFEDEKLFAFAREELTRLAAGNQPFNFTLLTADTHFPDGFLCPQCPNEHELQYSNVLACSADQVAGFLEWVKKQSFYENTTIVISGDHQTMDPLFLEDIDENYTRTIYNCIINAPKTPAKEKNRRFATIDLFPTTLSAMGVKIEGDRLGLGTDLFSEKPTLAEQYGFETVDEELMKKSQFYNKEFLNMTE